MQKANVFTVAPQPAIPLSFSSQWQSQLPRECPGTMSVLRQQPASDAEIHPGGQTNNHCPSGEFRRRAVPPVQTYRRFALRQHWRKRPRRTIRGVLAATSCGEIAADGRGRHQNGNRVRRFELVRQSALNFSFCDTNSSFFFKSRKEAGHSFG